MSNRFNIVLAYYTDVYLHARIDIMSIGQSPLSLRSNQGAWVYWYLDRFSLRGPLIPGARLFLCMLYMGMLNF